MGPWWKGMDVEVGKETIHCDTVYDVLDKMCRVPERPTSAPMRMPISGIYKIKGVGDVLAGRVEQGVVKPGEEVVFLPTHTASNPCTGKVFTVEMHHQRVDFANSGDNVGLNIKGLDKNNMPRSGDVMVYKKDTTLGQTREFDAQIQVPHLQAQVEDGQRDWRQKDGGPALPQIQRDGPMLLPAPAAIGMRHVQELRGLVARRVHGRQRCGHVGKGCLLRAERGGRRGRQGKVIVANCSSRTAL